MYVHKINLSLDCGCLGFWQLRQRKFIKYANHTHMHSWVDPPVMSGLKKNLHISSSCLKYLSAQRLSGRPSLIMSKIFSLLLFNLLWFIFSHQHWEILQLSIYELIHSSICDLSLFLQYKHKWGILTILFIITYSKPWRLPKIYRVNKKSVVFWKWI